MPERKDFIMENLALKVNAAEKETFFVKINDKNLEKPTVSGRELHAALGIETPYHIWFPRMCEYGFTEKNDYRVLNKNVQNPQGGRPSTDHEITVGMAKELCMIQRNEKGKFFRQYFIWCEEQLNKRVIERAKGIGIRTALTDVIKATGENERMHGHAYSLYTDLIYRSLFGKTAKQIREFFGISKDDSLRDKLNDSELSAISKYEDVAKSLMNAGWGYSEIKEFLMNKANFKVTFENRFQITDTKPEI